MATIQLQYHPRVTTTAAPAVVADTTSTPPAEAASELTAAQLMWQAADLVTTSSSKVDKFCALRLYGHCFPDHSDAYSEAQIARAWELHEEILSYGNRPTEPRINYLLAQIADIGFGRD